MIIVRRAILLAVNMSLELLGALQNSSTTGTGVILDVDNQTYQVVGGDFTMIPGSDLEVDVINQTHFDEGLNDSTYTPDEDGNPSFTPGGPADIDADADTEIYPEPRNSTDIVGTSDWTYHDETWHGNHPEDEPFRWVLVGTALDNLNEEYCMEVRTPIQSSQTIGVSECDWAKEEQLFFWADGKRMRPFLDISLCVDANDGSWPILRQCEQNGPHQRWDAIDAGTWGGILLSPRTDADLCLISTEVSRGAIENSSMEFGTGQCAEWKKQNFPVEDIDLDNGETEQHEEQNEEVISPDESAVALSDYVYLINRAHDYDDPDAKCLKGNDRGELKLVECERDNYKMHWLTDDFDLSNESAAVRLRPRSDSSLCITRGNIDKPLSDIHCCVDDPRLFMKSCDGSSEQLWQYDRTFGYLSPADYETLCIASWFNPRVGLSYCAFGAIEEQSYGKFRFDLVDPANGLTRPAVIAEDADNMFWVESAVNQIPRRLWCSVSDGGQNCKVVAEQDDDGDIDEDFESVDAIWFRDNDGRLRCASDTSICLTHDSAYGNLYATTCYQYRDDQQIWRYDNRGNMELSPKDDRNVCVVAKLGDDPPVEVCRSGVNKQYWRFVPFNNENPEGPSSCDDALEDAQMIVWKGGEGYYCVEASDVDEGNELELEKCDSLNENQFFIFENDRWMPKRNPDLCVQAIKNEDTEGMRVPIFMPCDGSSKQTWELGEDGTIAWGKDDTLCASYHFDGERSWFYNFGLKTCSNGEIKDQMFQIISPNDYHAPMLNYVLLSTKNDLSWAISCYPDHEENTCPGYREIRPTYGKFYEGTKWFIEELEDGIRLRRGEPRGPMLKVDGQTLWKYNPNSKELKSIDSGQCIDNRGQIGKPCELFCEHCDSYSCYGSTGDLTLSKCTGNVRQQWILQDADAFLYSRGSDFAGKPNEKDFHLLVSSKDSDFCIGAKDPYSRHPDGEILLARCNPTDTKQIWAFEAIEGRERIRLRANLSLCMHVSRVELLQTLHLEECNDLQQKQHWKYDRSGNGKISAGKNENLCVGFDSDGGCLEGAIPLELLPCSDEESPKQSFDLVQPTDYWEI